MYMYTPTVVIPSHVRITAVKLQHVHLPVSQGLRVQLIVADRAWESSARVTSNVLVDAKLQAFRMYLQHQLHSWQNIRF